MARSKKNDLPKGLREYGTELADPQFSAELLERLKDLPECGLHAMIERHAESLRAVTEAQARLQACLKRSRELAEETFRAALAGWSIREVQKATGYDEE